MIECVLDRIDGHVPPPTPKAIERIRQEQLEALKAFRRKLLQVRHSARSTG